MSEEHIRKSDPPAKSINLYRKVLRDSPKPTVIARNSAEWGAYCWSYVLVLAQPRNTEPPMTAPAPENVTKSV